MVGICNTVLKTYSIQPWMYVRPRYHAVLMCGVCEDHEAACAVLLLDAEAYVQAIRLLPCA